MILSTVTLTLFLLSVFTSLLWQLQRGDLHQPSATPDTLVPAMSSDLPRTALHEQLPAEAPSKQRWTHLADASKQPGFQPAMSRSKEPAEQPSLAASQQQEEPSQTADQPRCAAVESSFKGADPSCGSGGSHVPEHDTALQSCVPHGPALPASSEQRLAQQLTSQSSKEPLAAKSSVPANDKYEPSERCTAAEARPEQAEVSLVKTRHPRTRKGSQQAESEAQVATAVVPGVMKLRTGLRPRPDSAATVDKRGVASPGRAESAHTKQGGADSARNRPEATLGSSHAVGRVRAYGRGSRRGRGRSNLFRSSHCEPQPAGITVPSAFQNLISCPCDHGSSVSRHNSRLCFQLCSC